jgi:hypothetical protein
VSTAQSRGTLIVYLLEPESDDGFATWNFFDRHVQKGGNYPVKRIFDLRRGRGPRSATHLFRPHSHSMTNAP